VGRGIKKKRQGRGGSPSKSHGRVKTRNKVGSLDHRPAEPQKKRFARRRGKEPRAEFILITKKEKRKKKGRKSAPTCSRKTKPHESWRKDQAMKSLPDLKGRGKKRNEKKGLRISCLENQSKPLGHAARGEQRRKSRVFGNAKSKKSWGGGGGYKREPYRKREETQRVVPAYRQGTTKRDSQGGLDEPEEYAGELRKVRSRGRRKGHPWGARTRKKGHPVTLFLVRKKSTIRATVWGKNKNEKPTRGTGEVTKHGKKSLKKEKEEEDQQPTRGGENGREGKKKGA